MKTTAHERKLWQIKDAQTTAASASFYDLTPGEIYNIEAQVIGSAGPSDWSDAGSLMVV